MVGERGMVREWHFHETNLLVLLVMLCGRPLSDACLFALQRQNLINDEFIQL
jgi:hypothetical protein